ATNVFRSSLSLRGRFAGIHNAVICYSETEDVLANPTPHGLGGAWSKQELFKGTTAWHALNAVPFLGLDVACEGGWGINATYAVNPYYYVPAYGFFANAMSDFTREEAIESPLFTPFKSETTAMHSTNLFVVVDADNRSYLRAKFLGDAIPATSFAAGATASMHVGTDGNITLPECNNPNVWPRSEGEWRHSDIRNVAYFYLAELYQRIVNSSGNGGSSE
ncbi:MAG: hypothetical protein IJG13_21590, partial [Kiritimatiellae bacterium]|nr:hypothetical protein [Kiritimatiellia bacterium]